MKISYWTPYLGNVGTIMATINSANAMKSDNHEITLIKTYTEWEGKEKYLEGIKVEDFGLSKISRNFPRYGVGYRFTMITIALFSIPKLIRFYNKEKPDVVMCYLLGFVPSIARIFSKHKPVVINSIQGRPTLHKIRVLIWKVAYRLAEHIIVLSEETRKEVIEKVKFSKNKVSVVNNPIINPEIDNLSIEKINHPFFHENFFTILGVGRLTRQKNFPLLIKAFKEIEKDIPNARLVIIGEGELRLELETLITELGLNEKIDLHGFVSNPFPYYKNADLFVLSSLWEDMGHSLVEAAYLKVPIISTDCPSGQIEFLDYGKGGVICKNDDLNSLRESILSLLHKEDFQKLQMTSHSFEKSKEYTQKFHMIELTNILK